MSNCYTLACHDCRVGLWAGQGWVRAGDTLEQITSDPTRARLYTTPEALDHLRNFLFLHLGHRLVFDDDSAWALADYAEFMPLENC